MQNLISLTAEKVQNVLQKNGCVSLNSLESQVDVSFNLFFLAIDHLALTRKIFLKKDKKDYFVFMSGSHEKKSIIPNQSCKA